MRTIPDISTTRTTYTLPPTPSAAQGSPWHSPVPYLFGGLAAMLGLIAFALLILACSYWRLSGRLDDREGGQRDIESGEEKEGDSGKASKVYEDKFLVIMAGDEKPTFLATPVCAKISSFDDGKGKDENSEGEKGFDMTQDSENVKNDMDDQTTEQEANRDHTQENQLAAQDQNQ